VIKEKFVLKDWSGKEVIDQERLLNKFIETNSSYKLHSIDGGVYVFELEKQEPTMFLD
jgi:hypothetical protein